MSKLVISIPKLCLTPNVDDRKIYVLAFSSDLNIVKNNETEIIGAVNENISDVVSTLASKDAMNFVLASVSNIFPLNEDFRCASLGGSGIMLYPNLDPKGFLGLQLFVIESRSSSRELGKKFEKIFSSEGVKNAVGKLTTSVTPPLVGSLLGAITDVVTIIFKNTNDKVLLAHGHSGFDFDNYGLDEDKNMQDFPLKSKKIDATLRFRLNKT